LVNVYDTTITEEEDALYQTINHGSSIHKAGFLTSRDIYALSHDEKFSVHSMTQNPDNDAEEAHAVEFGDLRETFGCEYVGDVVARPGGTAVIGLGSHRSVGFFPHEPERQLSCSQATFHYDGSGMIDVC
jgi:SEL1 protein